MSYLKLKALQVFLQLGKPSSFDTLVVIMVVYSFEFERGVGLM